MPSVLDPKEIREYIKTELTNNWRKQHRLPMHRWIHEWNAIRELAKK